ncbi:MAG: DUF1987 domain-containing protein [Bacteroidales bacterium]
MDTFFIKPTEDTPLIRFDPKTGCFEFSGNSLPENASMFYEPVIQWLDEYNKSPQKKTTFVFKIKVISSSSSKIFFDILSKIDDLNENENSDVKVLWYYTVYDDEIRETGLDYRDSMNVPFELILIDEEKET